MEMRKDRKVVGVVGSVAGFKPFPPEYDTKVSHLSQLARSVGDTLSVFWDF
jgi:hypothetical protein